MGLLLINFPDFSKTTSSDDVLECEVILIRFYIEKKPKLGYNTAKYLVKMEILFQTENQVIFIRHIKNLLKLNLNLNFWDD